MAPYEILRCSWPRSGPRPVIGDPGEPDWDAPLTHLRPQPQWRDDAYWTIDWRELFRGSPRFGGHMRGFHIVFQIRVNAAGDWLMRGTGRLVVRHGARTCVEAGDVLEIAQWQEEGDWTWGARIDEPHCSREARIGAFLPSVVGRLESPDGPPLKIFCHGGTPLRTTVAIYSMILHGYAPSSVHLYGDYQWPEGARQVFSALLPFARVSPIEEVVGQIDAAGGEALVAMARQKWFVMKSCVSLLCGPAEFCLMDDDIFILDGVQDALAAFRECDFVFAPDADYGESYRMLWYGAFANETLRATAALNTGLYWLRRVREPKEIGRLMLQGGEALGAEWAWEQGFFANLYAQARVVRLPQQRYFYPLFDGMPGGIAGYDYAMNPCGFASVHFGGPVNKPGDSLTQMLAPQILRPRVGVRS